MPKGQLQATLAVATLAALPIAASAAMLTADDLTTGDLAITEYLADPVGISDALGEYFEIYNTLTDSVDLDGLVIRDDGSNSFVVSGATIPALSFAVFSSSDGASLAISPDYVYGSAMSLTNTDDEIGLYRADDLLIHKVAWDDGDFFGDGVAHELTAITAGVAGIVSGPAAGGDFAAAAGVLPLGNFGSPGTAGITDVSPAAVPLPATGWLFGPALAGIVGFGRRRRR